MDGTAAGGVVAADAPEGAQRGLNKRQAAFVKHVVEGHSHSKAAEMAGYASPQQDGYRLSHMPQVLDAISEEMRCYIITSLIPLAGGVVSRALQMPGDPTKLQLDAAKVAFSLPSLLTQKDYSSGSHSQGQLEKLIEALEQKASAIDITPISGHNAPDNPLETKG